MLFDQATERANVCRPLAYHILLFAFIRTVYSKVGGGEGGGGGYLSRITPTFFKQSITYHLKIKY